MEGLIPLLYKAIKDRRSGRPAYPGGSGGTEHDRFVSAAGAAVDLDDPEQRRRWLQQEVRSPLHTAAAAAEGRQHRRNRSLEDLAGEVGLSPDRRLRVALPKARSVRVFSCISAGAA